MRTPASASTRRHLWSNLALLALLVVQVGTGLAGLLGVAVPFRVLLWLHAAGAYAVVAVLIAKAALVRTAVRRRPGWTWPRIQLTGVAVLLAATVVSGLVWISAGRHVILGVSLVNWHAYVAIVLLATVTPHVLDRRRVTTAPAARDRRAVLLGAGAFAAGAAAALVERPLQRALGTPGGRRRWTGSCPVGATGPFPTVSWLDDHPAPLDAAAWSLVVDGHVARPLRLDLSALRAMTPATREVTLDCTGGWYTRRAWTGVPLDRLLGAAGVLPGARAVRVVSVTGYDRRFALGDAGRLLLATHVERRPLEHGHGAPARLVVPGGRGFDWVKWVVRVEVTGRRAWAESPLPVT